MKHFYPLISFSKNFVYVLLIYFNRNKNLIYLFEITIDINHLIAEASKKQKKKKLPRTRSA